MDHIELVDDDRPRYEDTIAPIDRTATGRSRTGGAGTRPRSTTLPISGAGRSSVRLLRLPPAITTILPTQPDRPASTVGNSEKPQNDDDTRVGRRRSNSEPRPAHLATGARAPAPRLTVVTGGPMSTLHEEGSYSPSQCVPEDAPARPQMNRFRRLSSRSIFGSNRPSTGAAAERNAQFRADLGNEYHADVVDLLDVVDPEVSTLNTLTNVQNSLFVPSLGNWLNRRQSYILSPVVSDHEIADTSMVEQEPEKEPESTMQLERSHTLSSIATNVSQTRLAVLPDGVTLQGWSSADKREINDRVRHMLHSRRSKTKRRLKAFGKYIRKPLGFLVTLYATLITLFGLAWVLFLIGWINVGGRQLYIINVIDNVLVALFAVMGDGLAPFRAIDTYHMICIAHYHRITRCIRRKKLGLPAQQRQFPSNREYLTPQPQPKDQNPVKPENIDIELGTDPSRENSNANNEEKTFDDPNHAAAKTGYNTPRYFSILTPEQQKKLTHHQNKFAKSHTFYKPHETTTHYAFPLSMLVAIVLLLDCHSLLQITLGACTWGISYHVRRFALTTVILCCSITCNVTAGILILVGDRKTRKRNVIEKMFRQELTQEAIHKVEKKKKKKRRALSELEEMGASGEEELLQTTRETTNEERTPVTDERIDDLKVPYSNDR